MKNTLARLLGTKSSPDLLMLITLARKGLPRRTVDNVADALGVSTGEVAKLLPISVRTLQRYEEKKVLDKDISDHLIQIAKVFDRAVEVFGNEENAAAWMKSPVFALGNVPPIKILDTSSGIEMIAMLLGRIEYGVYS